MEKSIRYGAVILAAGRSQRMGTPKMLLPFGEDNTFLNVILKGYKSIGCDEIIVVVNERDRPFIDKSVSNVEFKIVVNSHPERQRFFSIQMGMKAIKTVDAVFVHNVDNPFVDRNLLLAMKEKLSADDYVVPVFNGKGGHPILLSKKVSQLIVHYPDSSINFKKFLSEFVRVDVATENKRILININTLEQYRELGFEELINDDRFPMNRK